MTFHVLPDILVPIASTMALHTGYVYNRGNLLLLFDTIMQ